MISRTTKLAGVEIKSIGSYGQASFLVVPARFGLAVCYSAFNPDKDVDGNHQTEIMGGFNVYFHALGNSMKLSGDIAQLKNEARGDDSHLRTRLQMNFNF